MYKITGTDAAGKRVVQTAYKYWDAMNDDFGCVKGTVWCISTRPDGLQVKRKLREIGKK